MVVDPRYLEAMPWSSQEERHWVGDHSSNGLAEFLDTYASDQRRHEPRIFHAGDRLYREVSTDVVAQAGGLEQVAGLLFIAQAHHDRKFEPEDGWIKCAILSW